MPSFVGARVDAISAFRMADNDVCDFQNWYSLWIEWIMKKDLERKKYLVAGSAAILTFLVYLPALRNGFVNWDDDDYVYANPHIREISVRLLKWAFFDFYDANWHPLTWISHAIDYAVWGLDPWGHHLTSIVLHAVNTFILVLLVAKLMTIVGAKPRAFFSKPLDEQGILFTAGITGLLFGLHPIHVESVAWISERKDLLSGFFFLLTLLAYMKYAETADRTSNRMPAYAKQYFLVMFFFVLALLSKPMAVTLPVVLLLFDWYPFERFGSSSRNAVLIEKAPFFLLSLGSALLTILAQHSSEAIASLEFSSLSSRVIVAVDAFSGYLGKMAVPIHLLPFYPFPRSFSVLSPSFVASVSLILFLALSCITAWRRSKLWIVLWGYYLVTLVPVLGLVQVGFQSMADRYTYLPSMGPFLLTGLTAAWFFQRAGGPGRKGLLKAMSMAIIGLGMLLLSYKTINQTGIWKNSMTLWNYEIDEEGNKNAVAYYHRGNAELDQELYHEAMHDYDNAIAFKPDYYEAFNNRGRAQEELGRREDAINDYTRSIALRPHFRVYYNRGMSYALAGMFGKALDDFSRSIELNPDYAEAYVNRGVVYRTLGENDHALSDFRIGCDMGNQNGCRLFQGALEARSQKERARGRP